MTCDSIRDRLGEHLTGALERDESAGVERHLAGCPACREERDALRGLEGTLRRLSVRPVRRFPWRGWSTGLAAAAASLALFFWWTPAAEAARVEAGRVISAEGALQPGEALPLGESLSARTRSRIRLADGSRVDLRGDARIRLEQGRRVSVETGEVFFQVQPGQGRFTVRTPGGSVEVAGTSFLVRVEETNLKTEMLVAVLSGIVWCHSVVAQEGTRLEPGTTGTVKQGVVEKMETTVLDLFTAGEREKIQGWVAKLGSNELPERAAAQKEFEEWLLKKDAAKDLLMGLLKDLGQKTGDLEVRGRLEELSRKLDSAAASSEDGKNGVQRVTLQSRVKYQVGGNYGGAAFSFEHGLRDDDPGAQQATRNDYDLLFGNGNGDSFGVTMVTDDRSRIKDLGAKEWKDAKEVPALTPHRDPSEHEPYAQARRGHLYLVHTKDSETDQYAMFRVEALEPGDHCEITWKIVPAPPPLEVPADPVVAREKDGIVVSWKAAKGAKGYRLVPAGAADGEAVETAEPSHRFEALAPNALYRFEIEAFYPDGEKSDPVSVEVRTCPEQWKSGSFELDPFHEGYSFAQGRKIGRAPNAPAGESDLYAVYSAGGATELVLEAPAGIGKSPASGCLQIPGEDAKQDFARRYRLDGRHPPSDSFLVRSADGGLANVRIVQRGWPKIRFEYLCRPPEGVVRKREETPLGPQEAGEIRKEIQSLDSDSFEEREAAFRKLVRRGERAASVVEEALGRKPSLQVEERLKAWKGELKPALLDEIDGAEEIRGNHGQNGQDGGW